MALEKSDIMRTVSQDTIMRNSDILEMYEEKLEEASRRIGKSERERLLGEFARMKARYLREIGRVGEYNRGRKIMEIAHAALLLVLKAEGEAGLKNPAEVEAEIKWAKKVYRV